MSHISKWKKFKPDYSSLIRINCSVPLLQYFSKNISLIFFFSFCVDFTTKLTWRVSTQQNINVVLTLKVLVTTIDAQWEGMEDVGSARCKPALLPPCPTIRVLSYSNR